MAAVLFRIALISLIPGALCLYCWGCHSDKSWADCESKLESKLCPHDEKGSVCQMEEYTETNPGGVTKTHYFKTCGLQSQCDGSECNVQEGNVTHKCVFHCCCYDNCNTGILWVSAGCHWLSQICYAVPLVECWYSNLTWNRLRNFSD